ncbi:hypothetical protein BGZ76_005388 [Entomortierella beljakovae]|nr:hypothetical protein BGZ76_005388 [Entomortierella beljakovae]
MKIDRNVNGGRIEVDVSDTVKIYLESYQDSYYAYSWEAITTSDSNFIGQQMSSLTLEGNAEAEFYAKAPGKATVRSTRKCQRLHDVECLPDASWTAIIDEKASKTARRTRQCVVQNLCIDRQGAFILSKSIFTKNQPKMNLKSSDDEADIYWQPRIERVWSNKLNARYVDETYELSNPFKVFLHQYELSTSFQSLPPPDAPHEIADCYWKSPLNWETHLTAMQENILQEQKNRQASKSGSRSTETLNSPARCLDLTRYYNFGRDSKSVAPEKGELTRRVGQRYSDIADSESHYKDGHTTGAGGDGKRKLVVGVIQREESGEFSMTRIL